MYVRVCVCYYDEFDVINVFINNYNKHLLIVYIVDTIYRMHLPMQLVVKYYFGS